MRCKGQGRVSLLIAGLVAGCSGDSGGSGSGTNDRVVSGQITIESGSRIDLDTADDLIRSGIRRNNSSGTAQPLPSRSIVGGYLSVNGGNYVNDDGQSNEGPIDTLDYYRLDLPENSLVVVQSFGSTREDYSANISLDDCSAGADISQDIDQSAPVASFSPDGGECEIRIEATGGVPFRYVLTTTTETSSAALNVSYAEPEMRLDEAVVTMNPAASQRAAPANVAGTMAASQARALGGNAWHLKRGQAASLRALSATERKEARRETMQWIESLRDNPDVTSADPNYLFFPQMVDTDDEPLYSRQWNIPLISTPSAWEIATELGRGVGVAVVDTGLLRESPTGAWHEDVNGNVLLGGRLDFVSPNFDIDNDNGRDDNPYDPGAPGAATSTFHGTHVANIIAAQDNELGTIGVAPKSSLIPVRVLGWDSDAGRISGSASDLIEAIGKMAMRDEVDVINLSLGGLGNSKPLSDAIEMAVDAGKLVVAAAGNSASTQPSYPAAYPNVVSVGAVDAAGIRSGYSNFGEFVDLVAPGGDVNRDANLDGQSDAIISGWGRKLGSQSFESLYAGLAGTSMSAPHVSGVYALMKSLDSEIDGDDFRSWLSDGALTDATSQPGNGRGLLNAARAMNAVNSGDAPTVLAANPSTLAFSSGRAELEVSLQRLGDKQLEVTGYGEPPRLTVDRPADSTVGEEGRTFSVAFDFGGFPQNEVYREVLEVNYTAGSENRTLRIPVNARLDEPETGRNAGRHYVILVDADDRTETVYQDVVEVANGRYQFSFDGVEDGRYFLVAGTDMDNNGFICENGEACAEYPTNGLPEPITVGEQNLSGLLLSTSFRRPTLSELGGPRYGFEGYRIRRDDADSKPSEPKKVFNEQN